MIWKYHIIKDKNGYWLAEVFYTSKGIFGWSKLLDTCCETPEELQRDLKLRYKDSIKNEILLVKGNKLCKKQNKIKKK